MNNKCDNHTTDLCQKTGDSILQYSSVETLFIPELTIPGTSFRITTLTIDRRNCGHSSIKFNFSSNLIKIGFTGTVNLQIFKQCSGQTTPLPVGSVWNTASIFTVSTGTTFSFKACDDICDECCTYYVLVTVVGATTVGNISISNANLSALVIEDNCCCDNNYDCDCCPKLYTNIFSKCSCPASLVVANGTPIGQIFTLASLSINTNDFINPCIELEFATNTILNASLLAGFIQVYKQCDCQLTPTPVGPVWYLEHALPEIDFNTFTFHVHDCECTCGNGGCCTYLVLLTIQLFINGEVGAGVSTLFSNSTLRATIFDTAWII